MKNTWGNAVTLTLFGESHAQAVGFVLDGLTPGIDVNEDRIASELTRRRPASALDSARREEDHYRILSGVFQGKTTGTPLCLMIENSDVRSSDYSYGKARPSHADYTAYEKYHGFEDYRGGGHFSGRVTAALTAAGGILLPMLENLGITIGTHILRCGAALDRPFVNPEEEIGQLRNNAFPMLSRDAWEAAQREILNAKNDGDSVGGKTQTAICGLPAGLGEPWFDSVEGLLSHVLFSLGGVKGVEFGAGFDFAGRRGSESNDAFRVREGRIVTSTNYNGGINGGITNGMPILFQCAVKPTPSISVKQETVDFRTGENTEIVIAGRHDPAIIRRICPVIDSVTALVLCDLLSGRYGTDFAAKGAGLWNSD